MNSPGVKRKGSHMYCSATTAGLQVQGGKRFFDLQSYPDHFDWIKNCHPSCQCGLSFHLCKFCRRDFCTRHGQYQRIEDCNRVLGWGQPSVPCWSLSLPYGVILDSSLVSKTRGYFIELLKEQVPELGYLWRMEWVDFAPHIHMTILCYATHLETLVKPCWTEALQSIGHPDPSGARVSCTPTENYVKWLEYIFKTKMVLLSEQCPPRAKSLRWRYWNYSKNYPQKCTVRTRPSYAMQLDSSSTPNSIPEGRPSYAM